ncbi:hypothetical protein T4E_1270 [Trichinella pseudospiralis]|uniref:Uncharacterized protein n=1 Tax=Trichinella pseudospiralis TaxID=6337 RepID=A0A0V0WDA0_TRIPS|nr:hypothetical protein T4E_1270 [Trichinella pseudospiralis]
MVVEGRCDDVANDGSNTFNEITSQFAVHYRFEMLQFATFMIQLPLTGAS